MNKSIKNLIIIIGFIFIGAVKSEAIEYSKSDVKTNTLEENLNLYNEYDENYFLLEQKFKNQINFIYEDKVKKFLDNTKLLECHTKEYKLFYPTNVPFEVYLNLIENKLNSYNECSEITYSTINFLNNKRKEARKILFSKHIENSIFQDHPWIKFIYKYENQRGRSFPRKFNFLENSYIQFDISEFSEYRVSCNRKGFINTIACSAEHELIMEMFVPETYSFQVTSKEPPFSNCLSSKIINNQNNICSNSYQKVVSNIDRIKTMPKIKFERHFENTLQGLSFCIDDDENCRAYFLEPKLYGFDYSKILKYYTFQCLNPEFPEDLDSTNLKSCPNIGSFQVEDALNMLREMSFKHDNDVAHVILSDYLCFLSQLDSGSLAMDWLTASKYLLDKSIEKNNYRALRNKANHYRYGTCGYKQDYSKYYSTLERIDSIHGRAMEHYELIQNKIYGIGTKSNIIHMYDIAWDVSPLFGIEEMQKDLQRKLGLNLITKEEFNSEMSDLNETQKSFSDKKDQIVYWDPTFSYRALEIMCLIYIDPPNGVYRNINLGIKYCEELKEIYLTNSYRKFLHSVDSEEPELDFYLNGHSFYETKDTIKIFYFMGEIYSGKFQGSEKYIDIDKAINFYELASELGHDKAKDELNILLNYKNR